MVRHDDILCDSRNGPKVLLRNNPRICKPDARGDVGIAPYDRAQQTFSVFCAYCDKICTRLAVIVICQPIVFSLRNHIKGSMPRTGWFFSVSQFNSSSQSEVMVSSAMKSVKLSMP